MADPTRAPGLRRHRTGYRLQPIVPEHIAEALAARWEATGEKPSDTVRRYVGEGIERDRRAAAADWQTVDTDGGPLAVGWIVVKCRPMQPRPRAWLHSNVLAGPHSSREDADTRAGRLNAHGLPVDVVRVVLDPRSPYLREVDEAPPICPTRLQDALTAAARCGYERATADASAYLRALPNSHQHDGMVTTPRYSTASARALNDAADAIESGAHLGAAGDDHG